MRPLGLYLSFVSVLTVAYSLALSFEHHTRVLLFIGGAIGLADLMAAYGIMMGRRSGLAMGVFLFALTLGFSGYFLSLHYFKNSGSTLLPDVGIALCSLIGFLISMSVSPTRHSEQLEQQDEDVEKVKE